MPDPQRWARTLGPAAGVFAVVFLALCLVGYDPADLPALDVYPPNDPPANPCGPAGAWLAFGLMAGLGQASYLVLFAIWVATLVGHRLRTVADPAARALGLALAVAVAAAVAQRWIAVGPATHPVGAGGYVGAALSGFLEAQFGRAGMGLILGLLGLVGLTLCGETLIAWPAREVVGWAILGQRAVRRWRSGPAPRPSTELVRARSSEFAPPGPVRLIPPPIGRPPGVRAVVTPASPATSAAPQPRAIPPARVVPSIPDDGGFVLPPVELLEQATAAPIQDHQAKIHARALLIEKTLLEFGYQVRVVQIDTGPVITQFEIELEAGLRVAKINSVANDLAIALAVPNVRIVSPIPNKTTVGIEVPNERKSEVRLSEVLDGVGAHLNKFRIPLLLGRDVKGNPLAFDLADMPHLLIAGRTGTGKSVCLNSLILSILMTRRPDEVKLIIIDPKIVEFTEFKHVPHLMNPVVTDMKKAEALLQWACDKMDERYNQLARAGVRNIASYNQLGEEELYNRVRPEDDEEWAKIPKSFESIVILIDELGDLVATVGKEVEVQIIRLAQKARAAGIHLILATQKPTVDVITGLIKSNLPARIAFGVTNRNDSRVVLDEMGAEKLLGKGDMLFLVPGTSHLVRAQGTYASDLDIKRVCEYLAQYPQEFSRELTQVTAGAALVGKDRGGKDRDDLYEPAVEIAIREGKASTSLLQRALGIGYGRAARLVDTMCEDGIISAANKNNSAREVLVTLEDWENLRTGGGEAGGVAA